MLSGRIDGGVAAGGHRCVAGLVVSLSASTAAVCEMTKASARQSIYDYRGRWRTKVDFAEPPRIAPGSVLLRWFDAAEIERRANFGVSR